MSLARHWLLVSHFSTLSLSLSLSLSLFLSHSFSLSCSSLSLLSFIPFFSPSPLSPSLFLSPLPPTSLSHFFSHFDSQPLTFYLPLSFSLSPTYLHSPLLCPFPLPPLSLSHNPPPLWCLCVWLRVTGTGCDALCEEQGLRPRGGGETHRSGRDVAAVM